MNIIEDELAETTAMVIDGNSNSRAILVAQLRDFGVGLVTQILRPAEARAILESQVYDIVLCEQYFNGETLTGQELLDDLRRNNLLPFSTVFIMVTGEATYSSVAEAAESALDGYLLKPHTANQLADRLHQSRRRKLSMQEIFAAIEWKEFERAAELCLERYENRGDFWLYSARIGAELMMRIGKFEEAQRLYEAIVAAKTVPWAKLGIARAQIESGQVAHASNTLDSMISEDPSFADAYDVLARAQFEMGNVSASLATYKLACDITPNSISRLQNLATMYFYSGDSKEASKLLERATVLGVDSKMFDPQSLVILAFTYLESENRKGLERCRIDLNRLLERSPNSPRIKRYGLFINVVMELFAKRIAKVTEEVHQLRETSKLPEFDFEAGSNLVTLCAHLAERDPRDNTSRETVESLAMRFCITRPLTEIMVGASLLHKPLASVIRNAADRIMKISQDAVSLAMRGDPSSAVKQLMAEGQNTFNGKLIETAYQLLQRYREKIRDSEVILTTLEDLRTRYGTKPGQIKIPDHKRSPGSLQLRTLSVNDSG